MSTNPNHDQRPIKVDPMSVHIPPAGRPSRDAGRTRDGLDTLELIGGAVGAVLAVWAFALAIKEAL